MSEIDEHLERQISRALDGELTEDERLALDRELIRHPELREAMERSAELDALTGEALGSLFGEGPSSSGTMSEMPQLPVQNRLSSRPGYTRAWWLLPGAVAAAILAVFWMYVPPTQEGRSINRASNGGLVSRNPTPRAGPEAPAHNSRSRVPNARIVPVNHRPTWTDRAIDRGVYGVRGSDGNIYLIEVNHTRMREQPGDRARIRPVGGDL